MNAPAGDIAGPASQFLLGMGGAINQAQLYEADNKILLPPIARLGALLQDLLSRGPLFSFQGRDQSLFVNEARLRCDGPTYLRLQEFLKQLEVRKVSGMTFLGELAVDHWKTLLYALARCNRKSPQVFEEIKAALAAKGLGALVTLSPLAVAAPRDGVDAPAAPAGGDPGPAAPGAAGPAPAAPPAPGGPATKVRRSKRNPRLFATRTYAKILLILRETFRSRNDPERSAYCQIRLQRAVLDLVAVCEQNGWRHIGLVNNKKLAEAEVNHAVNVAILSLILGLKVGLSRPRLAELALAALVHDAGKSRLPRELLDKPAPFSLQDRQALEQHPALGVRSLLDVKPCNESLLKRILVVGEHHRPAGENPDLHLFSRIVAVAEAFDALTSERPHRPAYPPDEAMRILATMAGSRLDPVLTAAFVQAVGVYPCGTVVELSDRTLAIVDESHPAPEAWRTPRVRVLETAGEGPKTRLVDLAKPAAGEAPRRVAAVVDPRAVGLNVSACLFEAPVNERGF